MSMRQHAVDLATDRPPSSDPPLTAETALDLAAADFAARAGALADLLQGWRRPAIARTVLASLIADDSVTFRELLRDFDPPLRGKCWWLRGVIERIVGDVELRTVCRLRTDLTAGERRLFLQLALQLRRHGAPPLLSGPGDGARAAAAGPVIAAGSFLDALRAEGLVTCAEEPVQVAGLQQMLARPEVVCL